MLEGPAEVRALRAGQWLADLFAYQRINKRFSAYSRKFVKQNGITRSQLLRATRIALREAWIVRKRPLAFTTLRFYALALGEISPEIVDEVEYWRRLHRVWGGRARSASDAKTLTRKLLASDRIPDLGYFVNGSWFDLSWKRSTRTQIVSKLRATDNVVVKSDFSERGNAVRIVSKTQFINETFLVRENSVVQRKISQHHIFEELLPGKEATIRMVTAFWADTAAPRLLSGLVKWDVLGPDVTTRLKFDIRTGVFVPPIIRGDWTHFPVSGSPLQSAEFNLPGFDAARDLVLGLHSKFPHYQLIGWDLGIDESGEPWIFEWNADHPAIFTAQAMNGAILAGGRASKGKTSR